MMTKVPTVVPVVGTKKAWNLPPNSTPTIVDHTRIGFKIDGVDINKIECPCFYCYI
jgi:hypothetical protein